MDMELVLVDHGHHFECTDAEPAHFRHKRMAKLMISGAPWEKPWVFREKGRLAFVLQHLQGPPGGARYPATAT